MALVGKTNEEKIWNFLLSKGLNAYGAAGLMGNLYAESALNPQNLQNSYERKLGFTDAEYTAAVDAGSYTGFVHDSAGYGLAQWTYWSRKQALLDYAKAAGASVGDLETQLGFLYKELNADYAIVLATLKTASSVKQASDIVLTKYEKPANQTEAMKTKRACYAEEFFDDFAGGSSAPQTGGVNMSTASEKRALAVQYMKDRVKKNSYTQGSKRTYFFGYPDNVPGNTSQKGYSDCSAAVMKAIKAAAGINIGSNTSAQINNRAKGLIVDETSGNYPDESKLLPGDCLYFKGNSSHPMDVGHVEMYTGPNQCIGHGSGTGPTIKNLKTYCKGRAGKKRYFMAIRWILDDGETASGNTGSTSSAENTEYRGKGIGTAVAKGAMNIRSGAATSYGSYGTIKKGATVEVLEVLSSGWYKIVWPSASCGYAYVSNSGGKYFTYKANSSGSAASGSTLVVEAAANFNALLAGTYTTTGKLNMRTGAGIGKRIITTIPKGCKVRNYGYYTTAANGVKWLLVTYDGKTGFCSTNYLKK